MKNFDIQCDNLRIRGIYSCADGITQEDASGIILRHAGHLISAGVSKQELCAVRLAESLVDKGIYARVNDISPIITERSVEWVCTCGHKNLGKFCTRCGRKQGDSDAYCSVCGRKLAPNDNFCAGCGRRLR